MNLARTRLVEDRLRTSSGANHALLVSKMYAGSDLPAELSALKESKEPRIMLLLSLANLVLFRTPAAALWLFQEMTRRFDPWRLWVLMDWPARAIVVVLLVMSAWSLGVMIDRWMAFRAARKQSRQFAPAVAGALRQGNLDEAIIVAERNKKSHLARVVTSGLLEFRVQGKTAEAPGEKIEASKLALRRA